MNAKILFYILLFLVSFSCDNGDEGSLPEFLACGNLLGSCDHVIDVPYCTFGYKLGGSNPYAPHGPGIPGPRVMVSQISFKFLDAGIVFKTIAQDNAVSLQFNEDEKSEIRIKIVEWSSIAAINFIEKASADATDITIVSAFIPIGPSGGGQISGLGHPAFNEEPCKQIAGLLVLNPRAKSQVLHEMGHCLGLGHVASQNVMNPDHSYDHLQSGDILGIQSIYGSK